MISTSVKNHVASKNILKIKRMHRVRQGSSGVLLHFSRSFSKIVVKVHSNKEATVIMIFDMNLNLILFGL